MEEEEVEEVQENSENEEVVYADQGLSIVVQRNLKASCEENGEDWLRKNVFHTKCTSQGNVCLMIIDSGNFENVVSTEMVQKLGLKTIPYPNPCKLCQLQKGNEIKVKTRCLVSLFIGKLYKDEVWCDVALMDICHLLFGRLWQFNRQVMYDGYKNTYCFSKDGHKIVLAPMKPMLKLKSSKEKSVLLTKGDFEKELNMGNVVYVVVVVEENDDASKPPPIMQQMLKEFKDVVLDEIPHGLPLMKDIQHQIDFVLEVVLPNKPAYRMSPKEHEELKR